MLKRELQKVRSAVKAPKGSSASGGPGGNKGNARLSSRGRSKGFLFGTNRYSSSTTGLPTAFTSVDLNSTFARKVGAVRHPKEGVDGICIVGCQPFSTVTTSATGPDALVANELASVNTGNSILFSPDTLNGPVAAQANLHLKYVFTDVIIEYVSSSPTSVAGTLCMGMTDGVAETPPASFAEVRSIVPSITFPFSDRRTYLHYHYDGDDLFFTEYDSSTLVSIRSTVQAEFNLWPSSTTQVTNRGYLNVWYKLELYQPLYSQGFTLLLKEKDERKLFERLRDLYNKQVRDNRDCKDRKTFGRFISDALLESKAGKEAVTGEEESKSWF
jgi:hypothetical protein